MASIWRSGSRLARATWTCAARRAYSSAVCGTRRMGPSIQLLNGTSGLSLSARWKPHQRVERLSTNSTSSGTDTLEENRFLQLADAVLLEIQDYVDGIEEMVEESDISLSQGVLKIDLGEAGTWVINRQIPNRQIWWSSPISGPRRYEYDLSSGKWFSTRDGTELMSRLKQEIQEATDIEII